MLRLNYFYIHTSYIPAKHNRNVSACTATCKCLIGLLVQFQNFSIHSFTHKTKPGLPKSREEQVGQSQIKPDAVFTTSL